MSDYVLKAEPALIEVTPSGFRSWAEDFFDCYLQFKPRGQFSPVPYFLCCRAIELSLKSIHLQTEDLKFVKNRIGHNLIESYNKLPSQHKILAADEIDLLKSANELYKVNVKGFEYFQIKYAIKGFSEFPNLEDLAALTKKIVDYSATIC